jgi:hypothetical protein
MGRGIVLQGGTSTGRTSLDVCDLRAKLPELAVAAPYVVNAGSPNCNVSGKFQTQVKFLGTYAVPKIDVQVGASYQSIPGIEYSAVYSASNADVSRPVAQGGMGRLPAGGIATGTTAVNVIAPGSTYGPRFNQIDLRLGKVVRFSNRKAVVSLDLFNVLNADTISGASASYNTAWLAPTAVVAPRLAKVSLTFDF